MKRNERWLQVNEYVWVNDKIQWHRTIQYDSIQYNCQLVTTWLHSPEMYKVRGNCFWWQHREIRIKMARQLVEAELSNDLWDSRNLKAGQQMSWKCHAILDGESMAFGCLSHLVQPSCSKRQIRLNEINVLDLVVEPVLFIGHQTPRLGPGKQLIPEILSIK